MKKLLLILTIAMSTSAYSQQMMDIQNDSITSLKIYYERRGDTTYYSLDFNSIVGYDYLTYEEACEAICAFPKSIFEGECADEKTIMSPVFINN